VSDEQAGRALASAPEKRVQAAIETSFRVLMREAWSPMRTDGSGLYEVSRDLSPLRRACNKAARTWCGRAPPARLDPPRPRVVGSCPRRGWR
jgi:hypothetical protein